MVLKPIKPCKEEAAQVEEQFEKETAAAEDQDAEDGDAEDAIEDPDTS